MKKVLASLLLALLATPVLAETTTIADAIAEEVADRPVQGVEVEKSGGVVVLGKQPQKDTSIQYVKVHKCGLVAIILLNGKAKE